METVNEDVTEVGDEDYGMQEFILRFNDTDIKINVDSATAYLLENDSKYAEEYAEAVMNDEVPDQPPEIEYLIEDDSQASSRNSDLVTKPILMTEQDDFNDHLASSHDTGWTLGNMELMINIRLSMEEKFQLPTSKKILLWNQIAKELNATADLNVTGTECHSKWRNMIGTYKKVLKNATITGKHPHWPFYEVLYAVYGDLTVIENNDQGAGMNTVKEKEPKLWQSSDIKLLINSRLEIQHLFSEPYCNNIELWNTLSEKIECVAELPDPGLACKTKWLNLLRTYRKKCDSIVTNEDPFAWPYYKMLHDALQGNVREKTDHIEEDRTGMWTHSIISLLVKTRLEMDKSFKSSKVKKTIIWSKISSQINSTYSLSFTGDDCNNKWRNLIGTYRRITSRMSESEEKTSSWPYYKIFDDLYGPNRDKSNIDSDNVCEATISDESDSLENTCKIWTSSVTNILIKTRIAMEEHFSSPTCKVFILWNQIAEKVNTMSNSSITISGPECNSKWRNLKKTYRSVALKFKGYNGSEPTWPFFSILNDFYGYVQDKGKVEEPLRDDPEPAHKILKLLDDEQQQISQSTSTNEFPTQKSIPLQPPTQTQSPKKSQAFSRSSCSTCGKIPGPIKENTLSKDDDKWIKLMLLDWKRERRDRWEEKKIIEKEKITALNNLTQAILSLDNKDSSLNQSLEQFSNDINCNKRKHI